MSDADDTPRLFRGFRSPNYTQVPDELFDELMPDLSGAELKTLLYVIRRTFGFKRDADSISLAQMLHGLQAPDGRQLDRGVGISKPTLLQALRGLGEKQIIVTERRRSAEKGNEPTVYRLRFADDAISGDDPSAPPDPLVKKLDQGVVKKFDHPLVKKLDQALVKEFDQDRQTVKDKQTLREFEIRKKNPGKIPAAAAASEPTKNAAPVTGHIPLPLTFSGNVVGQSSSDHRGRPPGTVAEREQLRSYLADFARELHDDAPLSSTITRVLNLFRRANLPPDQWADYLYRARTITQERTAQIRSTATTVRGGLSPKNKVPYFVAVLEDLLGLKPSMPTTTPSKSERQDPVSARASRPSRRPLPS